jgi:hypothetical protein
MDRIATAIVFCTPSGNAQATAGFSILNENKSRIKNKNLELIK